MVLAEAGEDEVLYTADGSYAANVEKAVSLPREAVPSRFTECQKLFAPHTETIDKTCTVLGIDASQDVKQVLYLANYNGGKRVLVLVSIRADQAVNEVKLQNELVKLADQFQSTSLLALRMLDGDLQKDLLAKPLPVGYIAPDLGDEFVAHQPDLHPCFVRIGDRTIVGLQNFVTGTNEMDYALVGANWGVDFALPSIIADIRKAEAGDRAIHDPSQLLLSARGIEVGHIFQLGTKYSKAMQATYTNEDGEDVPLVMGCYGLGVSRLAQSAVEQSHDQDGIIWHEAIAPYQVIICVPNVKDEAQMTTAEQIYQELLSLGVEVLLDDRDERAGVKFKDADLVGIPYRIVTGKTIKEGMVEITARSSKRSELVPIDKVGTWLENARIGHQH
jgi:prolyl-tRNA synthetase